MKIGLIAISGLRLCQPDLMDLGMSFPSVKRRAKEIEALPSLGLLTIAALTPPGVEVEYMEIRDVDLDELPLDFDAVALSTLTATSKEAYRLAARFRAAGVPVILGGLHASLMPEEGMKHVDAVVAGEGETVWPEVVRDLQRGELKAFYDARTRAPFDMRHAPLPRFDLLHPDRYPRFTVQTQRGCPFECEFCAASIRLGGGFKVKPAEKTVAEIRYLKELYTHPFVEFADDNTFANKRHGRELVKALIPEQIKWFTETDVSVAEDEELLRMMRDAGCAQILIGFEMPSSAALAGVELKSDWKARRVDKYLKAVETIQSHGITVNGCFVLGMDGTGPESFRDVARFVRSSGLYDVQITYLTPFPGTPLYQRLTEEGRILVEGAWERCTLFDINFVPDSMSVDRLESEFRKLAALLYGEKAVEARTRRFKGHLRRKVRERYAAPKLAVQAKECVV